VAAAVMHPTLRRLVIGMIAAWMGSNGFATEGVKHSRASFQSHGKKIRVDVFSPTAHGPHREVIVLPGAGGMLFDGPQMKRVARGLAAAGVKSYVVNYFNRTHSLVALNDGIMIRGFSTWMQTVSDAVDWIAAPKQNKRSVGIYGYSLGGFLAVAVGSTNPQVGAVVEQSGGMWDRFFTLVEPLPSVLVIHGRKDNRVFFEKNTRLIRDYVERDGGEFHALIFDEESHGFTKAAMQKSITATAAFFQQHLPEP